MRTSNSCITMPPSIMKDGTEIVLDARAIFKVVEDYILAAVSENREETEAYLRELEENENRILNQLTVYHQGRRMVTGFLKDFEGHGCVNREHPK